MDINRPFCWTILHLSTQWPAWPLSVSEAGRPLSVSEAGGDLVLIQTSLFLLCKSSCSNANKSVYMTKAARSVSESLVTSSLAAIQRPGHQSDKSFRPSDEARYRIFKPKSYFWSLFTKGRTRICIPLLNRELKQTTTAGSSQKRHQTKG